MIGIANEQSIAYGCAQAMSNQGATLAVTYLNEKTKSFTEPLMNGISCEIFKAYSFASAITGTIIPIDGGQHIMA